VHDFLKGVNLLLDDNGIFVTENHDVNSIIEGGQFDTIYHEHLRYYSPGSLTYLLESEGFHVESITPISTHGGSFRTVAKRQLGNFPHNVNSAAASLRGTLYSLHRADLTKQHRQKIYGIGATTRATPLIFYSGIQDFIDCVCEVPGSDKIGTNMPGTQIPIVSEQKLYADQPPYALLLSWHMEKFIVPALRARGYTGKIIVPLPKVRIIGG
jgi:hypothetical protein